MADNVNGYRCNRSFHNYADYALSETFRQGLATLIVDRARPLPDLRRYVRGGGVVTLSPAHHR